MQNKKGSKFKVLNDRSKNFKPGEIVVAIQNSVDFVLCVRKSDYVKKKRFMDYYDNKIPVACLLYSFDSSTQVNKYKGKIKLITCIVTCLLIAISIIIVSVFDNKQIQKEHYTDTAQVEIPAFLFDRPEPVYVQIVSEPKEELFIPAEIDTLARVVFAESGNQSYKGKVLVAATIRNRFRTGNYLFPINVVNQPGQYASAKELSEINTATERKQYEDCKKALIEAFNSGDTYKDIKYFCNPKTSDPVMLQWFKNELELVTIEGQHYFYREKAK